MPPKATPPYGLVVWATAAITTDPRCCDGSHPSVIPAGTRGTATAHRSDFRATNVTFRGHPHPILCLCSMVQTRRDRPPRAAVDRWVHDLHTAGPPAGRPNRAGDRPRAVPPSGAARPHRPHPAGSRRPNLTPAKETPHGNYRPLSTLQPDFCGRVLPPL